MSIDKKPNEVSERKLHLYKLNRDEYLREVKLAKFLKKKEEEDKGKNQFTESTIIEEESKENANKSWLRNIIDSYSNGLPLFIRKILLALNDLLEKPVIIKPLKNNVNTQLSENQLYMQKIEEDIKKKTYAPIMTTSNYDYSFIKSKTFIKMVHIGELLNDEQKTLYKASIDEECYNSLLQDKKYKIL